MKRRTDISGRLLEKKHARMAEGAFPFLRATFYRWVEQWPGVCPQLARRDEDVVLAVGDLHVENFGVWRDSRERHVWGVNDFDDACELPFTSDFVWLAASVGLAAEQQQVTTWPGEILRLAARGVQSRASERGRRLFWSRTTRRCAS